MAKRKPKPAASLPEMLTVDEVAALLRVDRKTVYEAVKLGQIPGAFRIGRCIRFRRDALLEWTADD